MRDIQIVTLSELLPSSIASDPDVAAAAAAIDAELRKATLSVPNVLIIPRIREITESVLIDLLAWQYHVDFYDAALPLATRRELVCKSLDWHTRKGTPSAVEEVVTAVFSDGKVIEWWDFDEFKDAGYQEFGYGEVTYGAGCYGGIGWGFDGGFGYGYGGYGGDGIYYYGYSAGPYLFRVTTDDSLEDATAIATLVEAIWSVKNTRSWLDGIYTIKKFETDIYVGALQGMFFEDSIGARISELGYGHGCYGGEDWGEYDYGEPGYGQGGYGGINWDVFIGEYGYGGTLRVA